MSGQFQNKKIAILAAGSAQGEIGGAERFYQGLVEALLAKGHSATLVNIPADESSFDSILQNYARARALDLAAYDLVISTKVPTFAVTHANHLLYLVHTTRVFYDMFDVAFPGADDTLRQQRKTIQNLDTETIRRINRRFSIGHEVSERLKQFNGISSEVLHPPLGINGFHCGEAADYFFLPGRLHPWKRVDLVIRAIKISTLPLKLIIAGIGEAEADLRKLAGGDTRIEFLGRVSDAELIKLYSNALAVPFVPIREDYGYVTLEAFTSGKPVITCHDSGEPLQFVKHGETGLICDPNPENLREALEHLFNNRLLAKKLGISGLKSIEHITWPNVADRLLQMGFDNAGNKKSDPPTRNATSKVAILDMQPIDPAVGGGRLRLLGLYHALGEDLQARYVGTYDWPGEKYRQHHLTPSLEEIDVPLSAAHHEAAKELAQKAGGKIVIDVAFPRLCHLSPEYIAKAREAIDWADIVIFSHPWVFPLVKDFLKPSQLVVYDSHNVEGFLRAQLLDERNIVEAQLLKEVVETEYSLGQRANLILACSQDDLELFLRIYQWPTEKVRIIPNGVMASKILPPLMSERKKFKEKVGLEIDRIAAIFIGSGYQPNVQAAVFILREIAPRVPNCIFVIAGGVGGIINELIPSNVRVTGHIDDQQKLDWLQACDFALNPMFSGSGTNIKMFDFMAAGLPVVSTAIGARGILTLGKRPFLIVEDTAEEFVNGILKLVASPLELQSRSIDARACVESTYSWERISPRLGRLLLRCRAKQTYPESALRLAHVSSVGQKCGIGEYTERLLEALVAVGVPNYLVTCATPKNRPSVAALPVAGEIGWHYDNEAWCNSMIQGEVAEHLECWGAEQVLIQYHPAFYSGSLLVGLAESCLLYGIGVTVEVHNFSTIDIPSFRRLDQLGCLLIAHSRREVSECVAAGFPVSYLPMLVPAYTPRKQKSIAKRDFRTIPPVIASTGFIRPHKGLPQLIRALALVRQRYPGARLLMQCALYPSFDSQQEYEACLEALTQQDGWEAVEFRTDFQPIEEVHRQLATADIAVLPYADSSEGASATAATILASGVPLLISQSKVFEDIACAANILLNIEPQTIAEGIFLLLDDAARYYDCATRGTDFAEANSVVAISRQLLMLIESRHGLKGNNSHLTEETDHDRF